jgi:hypothetical protein
MASSRFPESVSDTTDILYRAFRPMKAIQLRPLFAGYGI